MFFDADKFWKEVLYEVTDPLTESVLISSYGLYAGISDTGVNTDEKWNFDKTRQEILNQSNSGTKVVFLLSESDPIACTPDCEHCTAKNEKRDRRTQQHVQYWPAVSWHLTRDHHLKAVIIKKTDGRVIAYTGGRNFTGSNWRDLSIRLRDDDAKELLVYLIAVIKDKSLKLN